MSNPNRPPHLEIPGVDPAIAAQLGWLAIAPGANASDTTLDRYYRGLGDQVNPTNLELLRQVGLAAPLGDPEPTSQAYLFTAALLRAGQWNTFPELELNSLQLVAFAERLMADYEASDLPTPGWRELLPRQSAEIRMFMAGIPQGRIAEVVGTTGKNVIQVRRSQYATELRGQYPDRVTNVRRIFSGFLKKGQRATWYGKYPEARIRG